MFVHDYWKQFKPVTQFWHLLTALAYTLISLLALIANLMVIYYLIKVKNKNRRQDGTYFLLNLAITDTLKAVFCLPMIVISSFYGEWMFDQIGCNIYGVLGGLFGFTSLATLAFMSFERYLIVSDPLRIFTLDKRFRLICIILTWLYGLIWILLQFGTKNSFVLEGFLTSCSFDYFSRDAVSRTFILSMFAGGFIFPLIVLVTFYFLTKRTLETKTKYFDSQYYVFTARESSTSKSKMTKEITIDSLESMKLKRNSLQITIKNNNEKSSNKLVQSNQNPDDMENVQFSFKKRQFKVLRTILLHITFFCIAWLPYAFIALLAQFGNNIENYINPYTTSLPAIFAKTSSIYNPILYTLNNKECLAYFKSKLKLF